jgi:hypothetical protein
MYLNTGNPKIVLTKEEAQDKIEDWFNEFGDSLSDNTYKVYRASAARFIRILYADNPQCHQRN